MNAPNRAGTPKMEWFQSRKFSTITSGIRVFPNPFGGVQCPDEPCNNPSSLYVPNKAVRARSRKVHRGRFFFGDIAHGSAALQAGSGQSASRRICFRREDLTPTSRQHNGCAELDPQRGLNGETAESQATDQRRRNRTMTSYSRGHCAPSLTSGIGTMTAGKRTYKHRNCGKSYTSRNEYLKELGFANYAEYLRSDLWRSIRVRVYACKGRTCKWCGEPATELHHSRYYRKDLTGQKLKYINPICRRCHQSIEFDPDGNKLMIPKVNRRANKLRKLLKWQVANG